MYHPHNLRILPRENAQSGASTQMIILVVCACVAGLILFIFIYLSIQKCRKAKAENPRPLPPVQPLAHHRAQLEKSRSNYSGSRPTTWYSSSQLDLSAPKFPSTPQSQTSLLQADGSTGSLSASRHQSFAPSTSELSQFNSETPLMEPPTFSDSPIERIGSPLAMREGTPAPDTPNSMNSSALSHAQSASNQPLIPSSYRPVSRPRQSSRGPRPVSVASATPSTGTSRSVIRGPPHSRHSLIQIVLPTPLAPQVHPYITERSASSLGVRSRSSLGVRSGSSLGFADGGRRWSTMPGMERNDMGVMSTADQWAPAAVRSVSGERSGSSFDESRRSGSRTSSTHSHSNPPESRQSSSQPPQLQAPPVPRVPSMYNSGSPAPSIRETGRNRSGQSMELEMTAQSERGRSRAPVSASTTGRPSGEGASNAAPSSRSQSQEKSRTLHKPQPREKS